MPQNFHLRGKCKNVCQLLIPMVKAAQRDVNNPYTHILCCGTLKSKLAFKDIPDGWSSGGKWNMTRATEAQRCQMTPIGSTYLARSCWCKRWAGIARGSARIYLLQLVLGSFKRTHIRVLRRTDYSRCCVPPWEFLGQDGDWVIPTLLVKGWGSARSSWSFRLRC